MGLIRVGHPQKNEDRIFHFYEDVPLVKGLIVFYHYNSSFLLPQLQCNKLLQVHSFPQCIFKAKGTHHLNKIRYKPGGTWIQKQHLLSLKNPGLIIEERKCRMIFSTKEPVYFLGEEGNQCRVKKMGEFRMKEKFEIVILQILFFTIIQHTLSYLHDLVISSIYSHILNKTSTPTINDSMG